MPSSAVILDRRAGSGDPALPGSTIRITHPATLEDSNVDLQRDAARLATIATVFVWIGWLSVLYAFIAGILWWIDLAGREAFNFLQAFAISAAAIGGPLFLALIVAGVGHFLRLFALYVSGKSQ
jgi:hypothetical protein